jgi:pimeloyl-ACP methyl ester carboxylesterase
MKSYGPTVGYLGPDSFTYNACDSLRTCTPATVNLNVRNSAPVAVNDAYTLTDGGGIIGPLLINDYDPDGDHINPAPEVLAGPSHGALIGLEEPDKKIYVPNQGFSGTDSFTYRIQDDLFAYSSPATVTLQVGAVPTPTPTPTPTATPTPPPPPPPPSPTPTPTPVEPLIFIPGISGSRLADSTTGEELWPGIGKFHDPLTLNPNDSPNPNIVAGDVIRSAGGQDYYGTLLTMLATRGGYREYQVANVVSRRTSAGCDLSQKSNDPTLNPSLFVFAYDWRLSNVQIVSKLMDYVGCVQQFYPNQNVNLLTHSMGSLLARRYILENPGKVKKLITIAAPWLGAPKSIYTLETGDAGFWQVFITHGTLKSLVEYFKSVHEIMPSQSYLSVAKSPFAEIGDFNRNGIPDETYRYDQIINLLNMRHPGSTPGSNNSAFHSFPRQDNWNFDNPGVEYHHFIGRQHINQTIGRIVASRETVCRRLGFDLGCFDRDAFTPLMTNGDGTVPKESATRISANTTVNLNAPGAHLWMFSSFSDLSDQFVEHTALTRLPQLHDRLLFLLGRGPDPGDVVDIVMMQPNAAGRGALRVPSNPLGAAKMARANHSNVKPPPLRARMYGGGTNPAGAITDDPPPADAYYLTVKGVDFVSIVDDEGNTNTQLDGTFALPVPNVTYDLIGDKAVFISTPADKTYTINFQVGNEPIDVEVVKGVDNVTLNEARRYRDVELPAGVIATISFGSNGIESLRYDADGDGVFETTITATATLSGTAAADITVPAVTISGETQQTKVLVTLDAQDDSSGVKTVYYSSDQTRYQLYTGPFMVDPAQVVTISAFADDNAANRSVAVSYAVPRLPSITAPANLSLSTNANESSCSIEIDDNSLGDAAASSNSSGTVTVTHHGVPAGNLFPVGTTSITYTATDSDGLIATATQTVTVLDKTSPTISCPSDLVVFLPISSNGDSMAVSYPLISANDNCTTTTVTVSPPSGSPFAVGTTPVTATAKDTAGNSASGSFNVSVLYRFAGFFAPLNNLPTVNSVNAGRAIPIKFSLSGNKGLDVFAAEPGSSPIGCGSSTEVELTGTVAAGNSMLNYDPMTDQYIYVWKTEQGWAGTCRQFVIQLKDGTVHRANFRLR